MEAVAAHSGFIRRSGLDADEGGLGLTKRLEVAVGSVEFSRNLERERGKKSLRVGENGVV